MTPLASHGPIPRRCDIRYAALGEDFGEGRLPAKGLRMDRRVADDAVALAEGVVEAGQLFAARGGLDPEAELANLDGLLVQVHSVEVVLENLPVEIEEGALAAQFLQPGVGQSDIQPRIAFVNGAEQAAEVVPDGGRAIDDPDRAPWFSPGVAQGYAPRRPAWLCLFRRRAELCARAYQTADL